VAGGKATTDGSPLLWKTRDTSALDNEVTWNTSGKYHFVSITAGQPESSWMGVNEMGFAIINTASSDLGSGRSGPPDTMVAPSGLHNGTVMAEALRECATGAAAFFETADDQYWRYDAANTEKGYILRTNFAINGGREGPLARPYSMDRDLQTDELMRDFFLTDRIDFKEIVKIQVRSFGDADGNLVPLPMTDSFEGHPPGYFPHDHTINRSSSVSFAVIQGVHPEEDPRLSTMWTILGQPSTGVLVPYWPVGVTPPEADGPETAPLADEANRIRKELYWELRTGVPEAEAQQPRPVFINTWALQDENGDGIWKTMMPVEDSIIAESEQKLEEWRSFGVDVEAMLNTERSMTARGLAALERAYEYLTRRQ
jgi:hypothetical protein